MIEEPKPDPEVMEKVFMHCLYIISDKGKNSAKLEEVLACISDKTGISVNEIPSEKLFNRLKEEGFIKQESPGTIKMLPCGDLNFSEIE